MSKEDRLRADLHRSEAWLVGILLAVSLVQVIWIEPVHSLWFPEG